METPLEDKINLAAKLATFSEYFSPRTVAQLNNFAATSSGYVP